MKRPAIFFDRDNTLIVSDGYLGDPAGVILVDGAPDAIAKARQYGFKVVTFSNQSGVGRGMFDESAVQRVNARLDALLQQANPRAIIQHHEYCPFHPDATVEQYRQESFLRKPKPGMLLQAAEKLNLDLARSWVIGDAPRDIEAGKAAGCRTILFADPAMKASPAASEQSAAEPDFRVSSLKEAIEVVARQAFSAADVSGAAPHRPADEGDLMELAEKSSAKVDHLQSPGEIAGRGPSLEENVVPPPGEVKAPAKPLPPAKPVRDRGEPRMDRLESLLAELLAELKQKGARPEGEFSISKLLAGIVQVVVVAVGFLAFQSRHDLALLQPWLLTAILLQGLTIALLIMGRQR